MKRVVLFAFFSLSLLLVIGGSYFWGKRAELVSQYLSKQIGIPIKIRSITFSGGGLITVSDLQVSNSKENDPSSSSLLIKEIQLYLNERTLFEKMIFISEMRLEKIYLNLEVYDIKGYSNNWSRLLNNPVNKSQGIKEDEDFLLWKSREKGLSVKELKMQTIECVITDKSSQKKFVTLVKIPEITLGNLGTSEPISVVNLFRLTIDPLLIFLSKRPYLSQVYQKIPELPPKLSQEIYSQVDNNYLRQESRNLDLQRKFFLAEQSLEKELERLQSSYKKMKMMIKNYLDKENKE
jgi:hypothetical protein